MYIAIDVGGVLIEKDDVKGDDTNFDPNQINWVPDALNSIENTLTDS